MPASRTARKEVNVGEGSHNPGCEKLHLYGLFFQEDVAWNLRLANQANHGLPDECMVPANQAMDG